MIVGAGLAGLIAAHAFPRHSIVESQPEPRQVHKALLRFRTAAVGELTGIEFVPVRVHKGLWLDGRWQSPNIRAANLYSQKVLGKLLDRSIWNLESQTRYIAPEDFYERLIEQARQRITWGVQCDFLSSRQPLINTAPLPVVASALGWDLGLEFHRAAITVQRYHVRGAKVYQTVYFPSADHTLYRASITGDLLICEFAGAAEGNWINDALDAFALPVSIEPLESVSQNYGKIAPVDEAKRKAAIVRLTTERNIFSLGRFATWRNLLLDDVVHDITVIKRLLNATEYERRLTAL
jgi:hypothetical protein